MDANVDSTRTAGQQAAAQDAQAAPELAAPQAKPAKKVVPDAANFRLLEEACASYLDAEGMEKDVMDKLADPHTTTLMLELGHPIYFSKSNQTNIKITTKEDLLLFEGYLLAKELRETR